MWMQSMSDVIGIGTYFIANGLTNHFNKAHDVWVAQAAQHCDFALCLALLLPASGHCFHFIGHRRLDPQRQPGKPPRITLDHVPQTSQSMPQGLLQ